MKKLVAISVLLVLLTASVSVFAQDEGKWTGGFGANFSTDTLWWTSMTGKSELSVTDQPTQTQEFGDYANGSLSWFGDYHGGGGTGKDNAQTIHAPAPDNRMTVYIDNKGENYRVHAEIGLDNWAERFAYRGDGPAGNGGAYDGAGNFTVGTFLLYGLPYEYWIGGNAGVFSASIGTEGWGGWVDGRATWGQWNAKPDHNLNRFGVYRPGDRGITIGDNFRTRNEWGEIAGFGIQPIDMVRISFGYRYTPGWWWNPSEDGDPTGNFSYINGSFMISARPADGITLDLFYSVMGKDKQTSYRDPDTTVNNWDNILGAYLGLDMIQNVGVSLGYTMVFQKYETGGRATWDALAGALDPNTPYPGYSEAVKFKGPITSGVDIKLNYSGIDKVGLNFNNNLSFARAKGKGTPEDSAFDGGKGILTDYQIGFSGDPIYSGYSESWFLWDTALCADLKVLDGVALIFSVANRFSRQASKDTTPLDAFITQETAYKVNKLNTMLSAKFGMGAVTFGAALFFQVDSKAVDYEGTNNNPALAKPITVKYEGNTNVYSFGIPITFGVRF